jgi:hypothetical protein
MIRTYISLPRVRDWKGYGIVQQCGTCEPLQSPTDVALENDLQNYGGNAQIMKVVIKTTMLVIENKGRLIVIQQIRMLVIRKSLRPV